MSFAGFFDKVKFLKIIFYSFLYLMGIVVWGTLAQKNLGLYEAQKLYFSSWIIWIWNIVPIPGCQLVLAICYMGLLKQIFSKDSLRLRNLGTLLTHVGSWFLLTGGLLTQVGSQEGMLMLAEGQRTNKYLDENHLELVAFDLETSNEAEILSLKRFPKAGDFLTFEKLKIKVEVIEACQFCKTSASPKNEDADSLDSVLEIRFLNGGVDQRWVLRKWNNSPMKIELDGRIYNFNLRNRHHDMPFDFELSTFKKEVYPGTLLARSYESLVYIQDGPLRQRAEIKMNEPLRYKGYSFYQTSYEDDGANVYSVFMVVKNHGRLFPYVSSLLLCLGLLVHFFIRRFYAV